MTYSKKKTIIAIIVVILGNVAAFFPILFSIKMKFSCIVNKEHQFYALKVYPILLAILITIIPDIVLFCGNISILIRYKMQRVNLTHLGSINEEDQVQKRLTRTTIALSMMHLVFVLPGIVMVAIDYFTNLEELVIDLSVHTWGNLNFSCNIFLYMAISKVFRNELKTLFGSCTSCCLQRSGSGPSSTNSSSKTSSIVSSRRLLTMSKALLPSRTLRK